MKIKAFSGVVPLCFLPLVVSQSTSVQSAPPSSSSSPASSSSQPSSSPSNSPSNGDGGGGASESATGSTGSAEGLSLTYASDIVVPATPPVRSVSFESHGPFTGSASVTGALTASKVLGTALSGQPAPTNATSYPSDGELHGAQPAPYFPAGGLGTNGTAPVYNVRSDYDYQSIVRPMHFSAVNARLTPYLGPSSAFGMDDIRPLPNWRFPVQTQGLPGSGFNPVGL